MKIIKQITLIFGICMVSELIKQALPIAFPGSVIGLLLVAFLLTAQVVKEEQIKESADFMLASMSVFFVPTGIQVFYEIGRLKGKLPAIVLIVVISLVLTFLSSCAAVLVVKWLQVRWQRRRQKHA